MTDDNSFLRQTWKMNLRVIPRKLEESGKILGKDLWVRAQSKDTPLKWLLEKEIDPVDLNGLNEITSSKELERMQSGNTILQGIFSTPEQLNSEKCMIKRCTGMRKYLKQGKDMIDKA